jgi:hypothetical protein
LPIVFAASTIFFATLPIFFDIKTIIFVILPIVFVSLTIGAASKKIILGLDKASPVPSWLFLELAARSHHC